MIATVPKLDSLIRLWRAHRDECRPLGAIMADARCGRIPGIEPGRFDFHVNDETAALAAMKGQNHADAQYQRQARYG